jgi:undecaprenyl-diphosphatase
MLERLDQQFFLFINSHNSPLWDQVMYIISGKVTWIPLYIAIIYILVLKYKRKFFVLVLMIIIAITLSDQISVLVKNIFQRPRPCHAAALEGLVHLVKGICGGAYGFISSHASNSFMVAVLSFSLIRVRWFTFGMIFWALLIGYSRVYLGVHYPGDVICGSLIGALVGWGVYKLYQIIDRRLLPGSEFFNKV